MPSVLSIISPILTANIISSITVYDFSKAVMYLTYDFFIIIVSAISYFAYHFISTKVNKSLVLNLQNYVYQNAKENQNINKISLSVLNDIYSCADFNKNLLYKICFLIKSIVILIVIIVYNLYIAFAIIFVSIISFLLLKITDRKIQKYNLEFSNSQNISLDLFNSIKQGQALETNKNASNILKDKYFGYVNNNIKLNNKISFLYNINNNFISLILKVTIFVTTLFLINQIKTTTLTLSLYLILTPYLTSSAENLISFLDLFSEFGTIENALKTFESLKFQSKESKEEFFEISTYNLYLFNVCTDKKDTSNPPVENINLKINYKEFIEVVGDGNSNKETLFNLLNKKTKILTGSVFIDDKNIETLSHENYFSTISFTTIKPYFYNVSIIENLTLVCNNKTKIIKTIADWGLKPEINKLNNKLNTIINENTNPVLIYFLGILKSYLSGAKIICIYSAPADLTQAQSILFKNLLQKLNKHCTVILFLSKPIFEDLADKVVYIEKGKIKSVVD